MADFQTGQAISVDYKAETTFGTLAGASGAQRFRLTGGGMSPSSTAIDSPEFRADGQTTLGRLGLKSGTGGYTGQFSVGTYDPLFEALFMGTWASDALEPGTTTRSFTVEEYRTVLDESMRFTGTRVGACRVAFPSNAPATVDFTLLSANYAFATGKYFTSPTVTTTEGIVSTDAAVEYDGAPFVSFSSVDFSIDRRAAVQAVVGSRLSPDVFTSSMRISGSVSALRSDATLLTDYFAESAVPLVITATDPSAAISETWTLPAIRFTNLTPGLGTDGPEIVTLSFVAGYDETAGNMISMTRDLTP